MLDKIITFCCIEKDEIFASNRIKGFFFDVACEMYGQITEKMHSFYNKIVTPQAFI